tara:strand:+ start:311 stop:652 length:342 start_codon:yes stop_codon:yes gene_type:complete
VVQVEVVDMQIMLVIQVREEQEIHLLLVHLKEIMVEVLIPEHQLMVRQEEEVLRLQVLQDQVVALDLGELVQLVQLMQLQRLELVEEVVEQMVQLVLVELEVEVQVHPLVLQV